VTLANVASFGEDGAGELYIADIGNGNVYKISPMLVSAASRKVHNTSIFDINLPLTGTRGVECRSGSPNGDYIMVFKFAVPLSSVGGRSITSGPGSISNATISAGDPREYIATLTGVTNAQYVTVTLTNVVDVAGNTASSVSATMGALFGDTTGNGVVNSSDIAQTQSQSGQPLTASNCREDVITNAAINSSDIAAVQSQSGTGLPSPPSANPIPNREQNKSRVRRR
jgi:hypothetical protein